MFFVRFTFTMFTVCQQGGGVRGLIINCFLAICTQMTRLPARKAPSCLRGNENTVADTIVNEINKIGRSDIRFEKDLNLSAKGHDVCKFFIFETNWYRANL